MHNNSNMRNKQMVINTCKIFSFFKISRTLVSKIIFSWFREFAPPIGGWNKANLRNLIAATVLVSLNAKIEAKLACFSPVWHWNWTDGLKKEQGTSSMPL